MRVHLLKEAESDLIAGANFHEKRSPGLGAYFIGCLASDIDSLKRFAGIPPKSYDEHRLLSKRFPYSIYYEVVEDQVIVFGVFSDRTNPATIDSALRGRDLGAG